MLPILLLPHHQSLYMGSYLPDVSSLVEKAALETKASDLVNIPSPHYIVPLFLYKRQGGIWGLSMRCLMDFSQYLTLWTQPVFTKYLLKNPTSCKMLGMI